MKSVKMQKQMLRFLFEETKKVINSYQQNSSSIFNDRDTLMSTKRSMMNNFIETVCFLAADASPSKKKSKDTNKLQN